MATGAQTWSTTAGSNNSADSSVNWSEGMAPSAVNNSARAEMASAAMWIGDNSGVIATAGTSAAFTATSKQVQTAVVDGYTIAVRFHSATEASATLNVDGVGGKAIQKIAGTNVGAGDFPAGSIHRFTYHTSSTAWVSQGYFNPGAITSLAVSSSGTITSTLHVGGAASIGGGLTASSTLHVVGAASIGGAATVTGALTAATVAGGMVATQADQEAGSATSVVVSPARQHFHQSACKAWGLITLSGGTPSLTTGYNVSSTVTDGGQGRVSITFTNALSSGNYAVLVTPLYSSATGGTMAIAVAKATSTTGIDFVTTDQAFNFLDVNFSFAVFGDI